MDNQVYFAAAAGIPRLTNLRLKVLLDFYGDIQTLFAKATIADLLANRILQETAEKIVAEIRKTNLEQIAKQIEKHQVKIITIKDAGYPALLKEIHSPPYVLFVKGEIMSQDEVSVSVVGSRIISTYGKQMVDSIVRDLVIKGGMTIVSGMAQGIDGAAHKATLDSGGRTIAVLGTGIDVCYPLLNKSLYERIPSQGAIISEFGFGTPPLRQNFPARNRIIAGLSLGTLVVEARERSGALITAQMAFEQNRTVFALPGNITSANMVGSNNLIKDQKAVIVTSADDILRELDIDRRQEGAAVRKIIPESKEEEALLTLITREPVYIDDLIEHSGLDAATVSSTLVMLEMKGYIKNVGGNNYVTV